MTHDECSQQLEAFALGALDPEERDEVAAHVAQCAECRRNVAGYEQVVATLPGALALAAPVEANAASRRRLHRAVRPGVVRPRAAVAAVVVATILTASVAWGLRADRSAAADRARLERLVGQQEIVFEVVDAPQRSKIVLRPPVEGSSSYGKVFVRPDLPYVVAMVGRLPQPSAGTRYFLWLTLDTGRTVRAGTLVPNQAGFASVLYEADRRGPSVRGVRVTAQLGDAQEPSGVPALLWVAP
jgi:hypothetical protein